MNIDKLSISFFRDFEKEYFITSKAAYLDYSPWDFKREVGTYQIAMFHRKDPMCIIKLKNTDLWLYEINNKFKFTKLKCIKNGFDHEPPIILWIEYLKEPTFLLYKIVGFGIPKKYFLKYIEKDGYIYMKWDEDILKCTIFSYDHKVDWDEYHADLVGSKKKF